MQSLTFMSLLLCLSPLCLRAQEKVFIYDAKAERRSLPVFTKINVSGGFNLYLSPDDRQVVAVSGSGILTEVSDGVLHISSDGHKWMGKGKVYISLPVLNRIVSSGSSNVLVEGVFKGKQMDIDLSGTSDFSGAVQAEQLNVNLSGSSDARISGQAKSLRVGLSGASDFKGFGLNVHTMNANASGACKIEITVQEEMTVSASGACDIQYKGNGVLKKQLLSGACSIKKIEN